MFSLPLSVLVKVCSIKVEPTSVPLWTEEELESFVSLWLVILSTWIKTAMFLLYHSEGCNIYEMVLHECYVNDLRTTTCSGMLGHHIMRFIFRVYFILFILHFPVHFLWSCISVIFYIKIVIWQYKWLYFRNLKKHIRSALTKDALLVYPIRVAHWQKDALLVWTIPVAHGTDGALRVMYIPVAH
jgi:hypothetical protein